MRRFVGPISFVLVLAGLVLRLRQFAVWRSLWMDEAMLALNVVTRSFWDLFQPLDYNQGAPAGFLLLQKLATLVFGENDVALRLVPLAAACVALVIFSRLSVRWFGAAGLAALALFVIGTPLVEYACEAKQYSTDVACTVILLALLRPWFDGRVRVSDFRNLAVAGAAAIWFSHPAVFVLPGAGLLVLSRSLRFGREAVTATAAVAVAWIASFALLYGFSLRTLSSNVALLEYWQGAFAPFGQPELLAWLGSSLAAYLRDVVGVTADGIGGWLALLGFASLLRSRPGLAVTLAGPLLIALAASGFGVYPFTGRLLLFSVPATLLLIAAGIDGLASLAAAATARAASSDAGVVARRIAEIMLAVALLVAPSSVAIARFENPRNSEALRPALEYLLAHRQPSDGIYVYYGAKPAVRFYARSLAIPEGALLLGRAHRQEPDAYRSEIAPMLARPAAWFVFSHACPVCPTDEWKLILDELDRHGQRVDSFETDGAAVFRYRFEQR